MMSYTLVIFECGRDQMIAAHEYDRLVAALNKRVQIATNGQGTLSEHYFEYESASGSKGVLDVSEIASVYLVTEESQRRHWQLIKEYNDAEDEVFSDEKWKN